MAPLSFECNVAYSLAVNKGLASDHADILSQAELWEGVRRGCTHPHEFAPYVSKCEVLSGDTNNFVRRLTLANGAVHTASGATIDQEVIIAEGLHVSQFSFRTTICTERHMQVEATTLSSGAKTTWMVSRDASEGANEDSDIFMVAIYELKMSNITPGSEEAEKITRDYTALAHKACQEGVETIRVWKRQGRLEKMRLERAAGGVYQGP